MVTICIRFRSGEEHVIEVQVGSNLLLEAVQRSIPIPFRCTRGNCGKCLVRITEGLEQTSGITTAEVQKMDPGQIEQGYRLACQTDVFGNVKVDIESS
ncbi:2Fe-2S iron-sulfur cluster-binding protein [Thermoflavimicrobium dichotomicum]|nr:2Fe-2S iron-sulfur cluster-binding protein [Thermoflavimicrobium dichotomicum]